MSYFEKKFNVLLEQDLAPPPVDAELPPVGEEPGMEDDMATAGAVDDQRPHDTDTRIDRRVARRRDCIRHGAGSRSSIAAVQLF